MLQFHMVQSLFLPVHVEVIGLVISRRTTDCAYVTPVYVALCKILLFINFVMDKCKIRNKTQCLNAK